MMKSNAHNYSISAMCKCLGVARATYYRKSKQKPVKRNAQKELQLESQIQEIFKENRSVYGSRKIKAVLRTRGITLSRRRIIRIMKKADLVSVYHKKKYRVHSKGSNKAPIGNILNRQFNDQSPYSVVVSDLTYVRVGGNWNYICILLDLHNREIIGYSSGKQKNAELVHAAFAKVETNLSNIQLFHTDRGSEFDNQLIDGLLDTFNIRRSLSIAGCPYDNAVAEATFKLIKAEFVYPNHFVDLSQLQMELADYVHWFNHIRVHSSLGYLSPVKFRSCTL